MLRNITLFICAVMSLCAGSLFARGKARRRVFTKDLVFPERTVSLNKNTVFDAQGHTIRIPKKCYLRIEDKVEFKVINGVLEVEGTLYFAGRSSVLDLEDATLCSKRAQWRPYKGHIVVERAVTFEAAPGCSLCIDLVATQLAVTVLDNASLQLGEGIEFVVDQSEVDQDKVVEPSEVANN